MSEGEVRVKWREGTRKRRARGDNERRQGIGLAGAGTGGYYLLDGEIA